MWNSTNASEYFWPQNNIPIITRICTNTSVINMRMKKKKKSEFRKSPFLIAYFLRF